jgi:hypothetical protein
MGNIKMSKLMEVVRIVLDAARADDKMGASFDAMGKAFRKDAEAKGVTADTLPTIAKALNKVYRENLAAQFPTTTMAKIGKLSKAERKGFLDFADTDDFSVAVRIHTKAEGYLASRLSMAKLVLLTHLVALESDGEAHPVTESFYNGELTLTAAYNLLKAEANAPEWADIIRQGVKMGQDAGATASDIAAVLTAALSGAEVEV